MPRSASDGSVFRVTGAVVPIDGGQSAGLLIPFLVTVVGVSFVTTTTERVEGM